jgi:hypothetical protein
MRIQTWTVVVCLLAGSGAASAQDRVSGGALAGFASATLSGSEGSEPLDFSSRAGFSGGMFVVAPIAPWFAIEPEVFITQKGGKAVGTPEDLQFRLTSLELPVLARFDSKPGARARAHVVAGPVFGIRLSATQTLDGSDTDVKDATRAGEVAVAVGAGFDAGRFRLDGRYTFGLTRVNNEQAPGVDIKTRTFSVLAGFRLW